MDAQGIQPGRYQVVLRMLVFVRHGDQVLLPRVWTAGSDGPFLAVATGDGRVTITG